MIDERGLQPLSERRRLQERYSADVLPFQDLCYATYTTHAGQKLIVDVLGTDLDETQAILSYEEAGKERVIWHAYRDQEGRQGTWLWTAAQLEDARCNPVRIGAEENDFAADYYETPANRRKSEIIQLGLTLGKSKQEIQAQLRAEGLDINWIEAKEPFPEEK